MPACTRWHQQASNAGTDVFALLEQMCLQGCKEEMHARLYSLAPTGMSGTRRGSLVLRGLHTI